MSLIDALRAGDFAAVEAIAMLDPAAARHPRAICEAARLASLPAVKLFCKLGAQLNVISRNYRPLHSLLQEDPHHSAGKPSRERITCLKWMLSHGADPELHAAWPPARGLIIAAFVGVPEYVACLEDAGAKQDVFSAAALGRMEPLRKALTFSTGWVNDRDGKSLTVLQCCAGSRLPHPEAQVEIARVLLDHGAEVGARTKSWGHDIEAIYLAASAKNLPLFRLFLERGADATEALVPALWNANLDFAAVAMEFGARPDLAVGEKKPLLNHLICWGQIPQTLWLLEHGASPNIPDSQGWTAVHQAASRGNVRVLQAVLDHGGDLRARDQQGDTPEDVALARGKEKILALLKLSPDGSAQS